MAESPSLQETTWDYFEREMCAGVRVAVQWGSGTRNIGHARKVWGNIGPAIVGMEFRSEEAARRCAYIREHFDLVEFSSWEAAVAWVLETPERTDA